MNNSRTAEEPTTYRVLGTTDEVTECGVCGKVELKGTVVLDANGDTVYAGFTCGAKIAGRPARALRGEALDADTAKRDAARRHASAADAAYMRSSDAALRRLGLDRNFRSAKLADADPQFIAEMAAWTAAHPLQER